MTSSQKKIPLEISASKKTGDTLLLMWLNLIVKVDPLLFT
jgi:hypothetical protein